MGRQKVKRMNIIFTIGEAAWSTCGVSGKEEDEGGRDISRKSSSTITIFGFPEFEIPYGQHVVFQVRREGGGTFQENQLQHLKPVEPRKPV